MPWQSLLAWVSGRVDQELRLKVEYLAAENHILRGQIVGRPRLTDAQRTTLATIGAQLGKAALAQVATIVTPDTILRWHRDLVAQKFTPRALAPAPGRPPTDPDVVAQVLALARDNPAWGYRRIAGALRLLDMAVSHQTVKNILLEHAIDPAPKRKDTTHWSDFIKSHADCLLATDFFTTEVWTTMGLVTYYVLFFINLQTRKVHLGGVTANPHDFWMRQIARNLTMDGYKVFPECRYMLRDRDTKFTAGFDMILRAGGIEPLPLPAQSPNLNAFAERFVRSIKSECLDRMIFFGEASFRHAVTQYIEHYHHERPHQGKGNELLFPLNPTPESSHPGRPGPVRCRERLGGLLKFYHRQAA